jgi:hypothetical protein
MAGDHCYFICPALLDHVQSRLGNILDCPGVNAVMLADSNGTVIASEGDPPIHPSQLGLIAGSIDTAMATMMRASRSDEFLVRMPGNNLNLHFHQIDQHVFLCVVHRDARDEQCVRTKIHEILEDALRIADEEQTIDRRVDNVTYITQKLNQLLDE